MLKIQKDYERKLTCKKTGVAQKMILTNTKQWIHSILMTVISFILSFMLLTFEIKTTYGAISNIEIINGGDNGKKGVPDCPGDLIITYQIPVIKDKGKETINYVPSDSVQCISSKQVFITIKSWFPEEKEIIPVRNLFNPDKKECVKIRYHLPKSTHICIKIYNLVGELIVTLKDEYQNSGLYSAEWDGRNDQGDLVASGIYLLHIKTDFSEEVKKIAIVR
jgi:hypothetical protein